MNKVLRTLALLGYTVNISPADDGLDSITIRVYSKDFSHYVCRTISHTQLRYSTVDIISEHLDECHRRLVAKEGLEESNV